MNARFSPWMPRMLSILRIVTGLMFLQYGTQKFLSFPTGRMADGGLAHASQNAFPVNNGGDVAILYCFVFVCFVFAGPCLWSLNAARARNASE